MSTIISAESHPSAATGTTIMVETTGKPRTLYDKIWDDHVVDIQPDGTALLYIDRHLDPRSDQPAGVRGPAHGRPQGPRAGKDARRGRSQRADHRPLASRSTIPESKAQIEQLPTNARDFGVEYYDEHDRRQGVVHIIGPEQGFTLPGATIVCGDSHTSTHGAFGALAHGIGTSEVEHVLATQTLIQSKAKNMLVKVNGQLARGRHAPRTSCWRSSARSAPPAAPAMSSNMPARPSRACRWKAA